jgi:hypothetical protein
LSTPNERPLGVLTLLDDPVPMQPLLLELRSHGIHVDTARDLIDARALFFGAGGHDCLVVAHDVRPGLATSVLRSLRTVDPQLPTATFGPDLRRKESPTRTAMLAGFHPGSRAGAGALLRFLRELTRR